jgi:hypothetical protein
VITTSQLIFCVSQLIHWQLPSETLNVKANQTNGCPGVSQGRMNLFVIKENPICLTESSHSTVNNSILTYLETGEGEEMMHRNSNASKFEKES